MKNLTLIMLVCATICSQSLVASEAPKQKRPKSSYTDEPRAYWYNGIELNHAGREDLIDRIFNRLDAQINLLRQSDMTEGRKNTLINLRNNIAGERDALGKSVEKTQIVGMPETGQYNRYKRGLNTRLKEVEDLLKK